MPLDRAHVTRASHIALPTHAALALGLGACWLVQVPAGPGAVALSGIWSLRQTAAILVVLGICEVVAMFIGTRAVEASALGAGAVAFAGMSVVTLVQHVPHASYGAVVLWAAISAYHLASLASLAFDESSGAS